MNAHYALHIPVKTYVRKYIEARYPQPMILTSNNLLGLIVYSYLEKPKALDFIKKNQLQRELRYLLLTDTITLHIPKSMVHKYQVGLNICSIKSLTINDLFEERIAEDLHTYCHVYDRAGNTRRKGIEMFCNDHNIDLDIDITYAAFKKAEYRYRKSLNKYTPPLSPAFKSSAMA